MPSSNVEVVEIGIPGPPGAGVTAAEKATFVTLTAANVFTNTLSVNFTNDFAAMFRKTGGGTNVVGINTDEQRLELLNGTDLRGFSDNYVTETWNIDGATGNAQFDGTLNTIRLIGESIYLTLPAIDGGGSSITTGIKYDFEVPYNLTPQEWTLLGDTAGSISIEFWKDTYANFPPTVADLVSGTTGTNNPRITTGGKGQSSTLTNWNTTWLQGEIIRVNVFSTSGLIRCGIGLKVLRT